MKRLMMVLAAAAILITACGHPLIPRSALKPTKSATPTPRGTSIATPRDLGTLGDVSTAKPVLGIRPNRPVIGVDLYARRNYSATQVQVYGQRMMSYIKNVLKANAVGIVWALFAPSDHSNVITATSDTLTARNVGILTEIARQEHLLVEYRPLIFVPSAPNTWEGLIRPTDPAKWFDSYYQALLPYLKMAQRNHVPEFVTATEMHYLNNSPLWPSFFRRIKHVYHGVGSYTAWDKDYINRLLQPVKYIGMDMYHHLSLPASATSAQVTAAWKDYLGKMPASILQATAIDETGIEARAGAYKRPQDLGLPGRLDEQVQVNWYTAACNTVHHFHMRGVFFWKVDLSDNPTSPTTALSVFEGRKGAQAIRACAQRIH